MLRFSHVVLRWTIQVDCTADQSMGLGRSLVHSGCLSEIKTDEMASQGIGLSRLRPVERKECDRWVQSFARTTPKCLSA